jgi:hypothetical protein
MSPAMGRVPVLWSFYARSVEKDSIAIFFYVSGSFV